jgi:hypothetical protein
MGLLRTDKLRRRCKLLAAQRHTESFRSSVTEHPAFHRHPGCRSNASKPTNRTKVAASHGDSLELINVHMGKTIGFRTRGARGS